MIMETTNQKLQNEQQQAIREKFKIKKQLDDERAKHKKMSALGSMDDVRDSFGSSVKSGQFGEGRASFGLKSVQQDLSLANVTVVQPSLKDLRNARKLKKAEDLTTD